MFFDAVYLYSFNVDGFRFDVYACRSDSVYVLCLGDYVADLCPSEYACIETAKTL